ncbi:PKD domain-containing protein [Actinomycetospora lutea]|uniref:PKD domain-containing protein n=1 Tax=Actinomycetospora lutea TaxID=663604 RepID=UPI002366F875|nr:PKD domain-containing protein [Actinomycetospora lutea]MDD7942867.1 PKD domain-containing protein [Actinomycetospora lutea]
MAVDNEKRLAHVGPRDPVIGFPLWYEDAAGTRVALGLSRGEDPNLLPIEDVDPGPLAIPGNFPHEAFYWSAEAEMPVGGNGVRGRARLILALEAAFGGAGDPADDARVVFARVRVRMDDLIPSAKYIVTHPYGVTDELEADEDGRVAWTDDRGIADENFAAVVRDGRVAPFLRWGADAPDGYVGNPLVEHTVTGSPFDTNFFRVAGPRIAVVPGQPPPADPDVAQTDLFSVQGKIATVHGVEVDRAVYHRNGGHTTVDVFATTAPDQELEVASPRTAFTTSDRSYTTRFEAPDGPPAEIEVHNVEDTPTTRVPATVTDEVAVTRAEFDIAAGMLTVQAVSSDDQGPALEVHRLSGVRPQLIGPISDSPFDLAAAPATIVVTSAGGGQITRAVTLTGAPRPPETGGVADAGPDVRVDVGQDVELDGTTSRGDVASFAWTVDGGTLVDPSAPKPVYSAPAAPGNHTATLTVRDAAGDESSDAAAITVTPPPAPEQVSITRSEFRTASRQLRVEGTVTGGRLPIEIRVTVGLAAMGSSPVDAVGDWSVRTTLAAADERPAPTVGDTATATTAGGAQASLSIRIRN